MMTESGSDPRSIDLDRSAPRGFRDEPSLGPYYGDAHRLPFRRRGGFARWYGKHGRTGELDQALRRSRVPAALGASGFSINGAAKIVGCSWHTLNNDLRVLSGHKRSSGFERWLQTELKKMEVLELRMAGKSFRDVSARTGVPLSTCHRWWHFEMSE